MRRCSSRMMGRMCMGMMFMCMMCCAQNGHLRDC